MFASKQMGDKKVESPYTSEELKALLIDLTRQGYNDAAQAGDDPVSAQVVTELAQATDPGRLTVALIEAIAKVWDENNRRLREKDRRTSFAAGKR